MKTTDINIPKDAKKDCSKCCIPNNIPTGSKINILRLYLKDNNNKKSVIESYPTQKNEVKDAGSARKIINATLAFRSVKFLKHNSINSNKNEIEKKRWKIKYKKKCLIPIIYAIKGPSQFQNKKCSPSVNVFVKGF